MRKILLFIFVLQTLFASSQKLPKTTKYVKYDTSQKISQTQLKQIAERFLKKSYPSLDFREKMFVDSLSIFFSNKDSAIRTKAAIEMSSIGVLLMGSNKGSRNEVISLTAKAITVAPQIALLSNNFGAVLHTQDSLKTALKVLYYAKDSVTTSPTLYTNIGNCLFELLDDRLAATYFQKALNIDKHFGLAREGLVLCYIKQSQLGKAWEELLKGVEYISPSANSKKAIDALDQSETAKAQAKKNNQNSNSNSPQSPLPLPNGNSGPPAKLTLPDFPDWADISAFANAGIAISDWGNDVEKEKVQLFTEMMNSVKQLENAYKAAVRRRDSTPYIINPEGETATFAFNLLQTHYMDRIMNLWEESTKNLKGPAEKYAQSATEIGKAYEIKMKALESYPPAKLQERLKNAEEYTLRMCQDSKENVENYFNEWKQIAKKKHNKTNELLHEYWIYCEPYLNKVYNMNNFMQLDNSRRLFVYNIYSGMVTEYTVNTLAFTVGALNLTSTGLDCGKGSASTTPPPSSGASPNLTTKAEEATPPKCPLAPGQKVTAGLGPIAVSADCTSVEVGFAAGVAGSVKHDFGAHETTVFVGAGVKAEFGIPGITHYESSIKAGEYIKFKNDGQVTDWGLTAEMGYGGSLGSMSGGRSYSVTAGAVTGINTDSGEEICLTVH